MPNSFKLVSSDNVTFEVPRDMVEKVFSHEHKEHTQHKLVYVNAAILNKVVQWIECYCCEATASLEFVENGLFENVGQSDLFSILLTAQHLGINPLADLVAKKLAHTMMEDHKTTLLQSRAKQTSNLFPKSAVCK